ncbi:hypothetical protein [Emcibacter sp. SYSU 3D8]|uniref:hypothetical protein n=1 Tax=Emcibacter sp. SYSU 3D8 TaxID=3133969 RepID=UPI0031FEE9EF
MEPATDLLTVTRRLILMTGAALLIVTAIFVPPFVFGGRLMLTPLAFACGIIGGFVSMQQRLRKVPPEELRLLAGSWFQVVLVPIFGGIFALVLYCMFLGGILAGNLFPVFYVPAPDHAPPDSSFMIEVLVRTYPEKGADLAKFIFWSFVAGFSERLVPQFIDNLASSASSQAQEPPDKREPENGSSEEGLADRSNRLRK